MTGEGTGVDVGVAEGVACTGVAEGVSAVGRGVGETTGLGDVQPATETTVTANSINKMILVFIGSRHLLLSNKL